MLLGWNLLLGNHILFLVQQIDPMIFKHLNDWLIDKIYEFQDYKTWKDYLILAIDGCLLKYYHGLKN